MLLADLRRVLTLILYRLLIMRGQNVKLTAFPASTRLDIAGVHPLKKKGAIEREKYDI